MLVLGIDGRTNFTSLGGFVTMGPPLGPTGGAAGGVDPRARGAAAWTTERASARRADRRFMRTAASIPELEPRREDVGPARDGLAAGHGRLEAPALRGRDDRGVEAGVDALQDVDLGHLSRFAHGEAELELAFDAVLLRLG